MWKNYDNTDWDNWEYDENDDWMWGDNKDEDTIIVKDGNWNILQGDNLGNNS